MYEIGRICIKLAGRDAGREAVIVEILDDKYVMIDGNVRRRKCNINHLEPSSKKIDIKEKADSIAVKEAFKKSGLGIWETKPRKTGERPKKTRKKKEKPVKAKKPEQKQASTEKKKAEPEKKAKKAKKKAKE